MDVIVSVYWCWWRRQWTTEAIERDAADSAVVMISVQNVTMLAMAALIHHLVVHVSMTVVDYYNLYFRIVNWATVVCSLAETCSCTENHHDGHHTDC